MVKDRNIYLNIIKLVRINVKNLSDMNLPRAKKVRPIWDKLLGPIRSRLQISRLVVKIILSTVRGFVLTSAMSVTRSRTVSVR